MYNTKKSWFQMSTFRPGSYFFDSNKATPDKSVAKLISATNIVILVPPPPKVQDTKKGESSPMERGGDKGGEGGNCSTSAFTNYSTIPPPSTHSGKKFYNILWGTTKNVDPHTHHEKISWSPGKK